MSGPKDFLIIFAAERLIQIGRQMEAIRRERALAVDQRIADARQQAAVQLSLRQQQAAAQIAADQDARAAANRALLARHRNSSQQALGMAVQIDDKPQALMPVDQVHSGARAPEPVMANHVPAPPAGQDDRLERLSECAAVVAGWQAELAADLATTHFQRQQAHAWQQRASTQLANDVPSADVERLITAAETLARDAEEIHRAAGELKCKFEARNELLQDIIGSLKEIGFYVADPQYKDPADPARPVIITANRGSEEIIASIDLSGMVHSVWDGVGHETCKATFFEYVDRMREKGLDVKATREDLQCRPILKQKGEKDLPRNHSNRLGS